MLNHFLNEGINVAQRHSEAELSSLSLSPLFLSLQSSGKAWEWLLLKVTEPGPFPFLPSPHHGLDPFGKMVPSGALLNSFPTVGEQRSQGRFLSVDSGIYVIFTLFCMLFIF